jgi:hypothetical protein
MTSGDIDMCEQSAIRKESHDDLQRLISIIFLALVLISIK